jgi:NhaP-type Na+/H+ or K+/H+ antiporter
MSPDAISTPDEHWVFPWGVFGILVSSPLSIVVGLVLALVVLWQRKRLQLWAWKIRGRFQ